MLSNSIKLDLTVWDVLSGLSIAGADPAAKFGSRAEGNLGAQVKESFECNRPSVSRKMKETSIVWENVEYFWNSANKKASNLPNKFWFRKVCGAERQKALDLLTCFATSENEETKWGLDFTLKL